MTDSFTLTKASGERQPFDVKKFERSLHKAGVPAELAARALADIIRLKPTSTRAIHEYITQLLTREKPAVAARYNLKQALIAFGPSGFPFEQYVAILFNKMGYTTVTDQMVQGYCVSHEIDVIAQKNHTRVMIECKFHNEQGLKSDVKVPLYIKSRFDDISKSHDQSRKTPPFDQAWIVCNTKFTTEAIAYGQCVGIQMLAWDYPAQETLADLIGKYGLHPITALTTITNREKKLLLDNGLVLCQDAHDNRDLLRRIGLSPQAIDTFIAQADQICSVP